MKILLLFSGLFLGCQALSFPASAFDPGTFVCLRVQLIVVRPWVDFEVSGQSNGKLETLKETDFSSPIEPHSYFLNKYCDPSKQVVEAGRKICCVQK